jgi:Galactose oxidase, central domain
MIVYGGFVKGVRTNQIDKFLFQENRWVKVNVPPTSPMPKARCGHSAVIHQNSMWIFGGKDDDNRKLNDLWRFDLGTNTWQEIKVQGPLPTERSGHSMEVFEGQYLLIFGGIYEITKELNDLHMFDLTKKKWITVFEESNSPVRNARESSPHFDEHNLTSTLGVGAMGHGSPNIH